MYHYPQCGLKNVYLADGYTIEDAQTVTIVDIDGLHRAIGTLIALFVHPLSGDELRFLREELDFSQRRLANIIRIDKQRVSLWEDNKIQIPFQSELIVRKLYLDFIQINVELGEIILRFTNMDRQETMDKLIFQRARGSWSIKTSDL